MAMFAMISAFLNQSGMENLFIHFLFQLSFIKFDKLSFSCSRDLNWGAILDHSNMSICEVSWYNLANQSPYLAWRVWNFRLSIGGWPMICCLCNFDTIKHKFSCGWVPCVVPIKERDIRLWIREQRFQLIDIHDVGIIGCLSSCLLFVFWHCVQSGIHLLRGGLFGV
jgi:hypothetical protein